MIPTIGQLDKIVGRKVDAINAGSLISALKARPSGIDQPQRLAHFLAQILHESSGLKRAAEIWGPTAQQKRYERDFNRPWTKDDKRNRLAFALGNSERGDGSLYRGYGLIQNTGRWNTGIFLAWAEAMGLNPPDFETAPHRQAGPPWSGLVAIWYWDARNLNGLADANNPEQITRRVNGGLTGYPDRLRYYWRSAMVLLGLPPTAAGVRQFQTAHGLKVDGDVGPATRGGLHTALGKLSPATLTVEQRLAALEAAVAALQATTGEPNAQP